MASYQQLKELNELERQKFIDSFDVVFCDCDGVLWETLGGAIPGAAAAIDYLRQLGKKVSFVTNNSIFSVDDHLKRFELCQIKVKKDEIVHPAQSVCDHLRALKFEGLIYCMATAPFKQLLRDAGLSVVEEADGAVIKSLSDLQNAIHCKAKVHAVVFDVDFNLSVTKLMRAHMLLKDPTCLFIGGAADAIIPIRGSETIGPGAFIDLIAQTTKREPTILGKPGQALRELLKSRYEPLPEHRVLFIGDSLTSDISFGRMCGYQTLVVLTGATSPEKLTKLTDVQLMPDYVADDLGDFLEIV